MKVLVTGGAGFIGSHLVELLIEKGYEVVVIDNLSSGVKENIPKTAKFYYMDINSPDIKDVFEKENPEYVFHLAAQVDVGKSISDPLHDANVNILGTNHLLHQCVKHQIKKIIFSSSSAVYGESDDKSILESSPTRPSSFYGLSKLTAESYIQMHSLLFGLDYTILRYSNVYGPRQGKSGESGVISIFIQKLLNNEVPAIFGDGYQTRDFVYVKDVALANLLAIQSGANQIINISTDTKTSIQQLLQQVLLIQAKNTQPNYLQSRNGDILYSRLANQKAQEILSWKPSYSLDTGLTHTIHYFKKQ